MLALIKCEVVVVQQSLANKVYNLAESLKMLGGGGDNWTILTIPSRGLCFLLSRKHPTTSEVWGVLVNS